VYKNRLKATKEAISVDGPYAIHDMCPVVTYFSYEVQCACMHAPE